eukprot:CAMPEP_0175073962 /NCGR_PEP_ID=MMETSP0052_2-20121109/20946_1 /TAXON_ID=51329 ORGANISM="Polytomella parva, Strain SAG 63-3" /NCGR_SAMPLE_ID=MMETSP0052_2 /ASSEMBLY_ACC=CAM_ASM_000194 /LENGTH=87 /DNA_ID=CAMNT_0016342015 /DNA_START=20 /DNA_END=279 /DNA_ORIENTATION=-
MPEKAGLEPKSHNMALVPPEFQKASNDPSNKAAVDATINRAMNTGLAQIARYALSQQRALHDGSPTPSSGPDDPNPLRSSYASIGDS